MGQVQACGITVQYKSQKFKSHTFKEYLINKLAGRNSNEVLSALNDISFSISAGESVAFVGHNGSGKSTLLKVLAGIIQPTQGQVKTFGRIAPMIELGAGFDQELSGSENIFLSCMLMGLRKEEVNERIDKIIRFAELEDFIHCPLKNYSSGMQARLGFACATAVDPQILLVDEVLSVGDSNFTRKCLARINELKQKGTTVVLVSHDDNTVRSFCTRALVLDKGRLLFDGPIEEALALHHEVLDQRYLESLSLDERMEAERQAKLRANAIRSSVNTNNLPKASAECTFLQNSLRTDRIDVTRPFELQVKIKIENPDSIVGSVNIGFGLNTLDNKRITGKNLKQLSPHTKLPIASDFRHSAQTFCFSFTNGLPFLAGEVYQLLVGVLDSEDTRSIANIKPQQVIFYNSRAPNNYDRDLIECGSWVGLQ